MSLQTVRRRLRLRSLTPALRAAFDERRISASVAEAAARLPEAQQKALEPQLEAAGRLSLSDVRHVAREHKSTATSEMRGGLFEEQSVAWQVTVRGHLTAALRATPIDRDFDALRGVIGDALEVLEKADVTAET
jgi:hypothetical protein